MPDNFFFPLFFAQAVEELTCLATPLATSYSPCGAAKSLRGGLSGGGGQSAQSWGVGRERVSMSPAELLAQEVGKWQKQVGVVEEKECVTGGGGSKLVSE